MQRFFYFVLVFFIFSCSAEAKTYRICKPTDLEGRTLELKTGSKVVFKKEGRILNGTVKGNNCKIVVKAKAPVLQNVRLSGSFKNVKAYLSWWVSDEDITDEVESLVTSFCGTVYLDRTGQLTKPITLDQKKALTIDGCGNFFGLYNINGFAFYVKRASKIEVRNASFKYISSDPGTSSHVGVLRFAHGGASNVNIHDVLIEGFDNSRYKPCGVDAIQIEGCKSGTTTTIYNVTVKDMVVKGDGKETNGVGANYAISVDCHDMESGKVEIYSCHITNMYNVDDNGNKIYEDTSGIYLGGAVGKDREGEMTYCNWNATIHDCYFNDISKRNIKIQGNHVLMQNLNSATTESFLKDYHNMYVGINGDNITIDGIYGQYDGSIVKITGDYLIIRDMDCTSNLRDSKYASVIRLDGTQNATIEDCKFDNDTYMFIYPTERNMTEATVPEYHIKRCSLNVKNLLYCITNYPIIHKKGILTVEDSDITLSGTYVSNSKSLAEIRLIGTRIKGKGRLTTPRDNGGPRLTVNKSEIKEQ